MEEMSADEGPYVPSMTASGSRGSSSRDGKVGGGSGSSSDGSWWGRGARSAAAEQAAAATAAAASGDDGAAAAGAGGSGLFTAAAGLWRNLQDKLFDLEARMIKTASATVKQTSKVKKLELKVCCVWRQQQQQQQVVCTTWCFCVVLHDITWPNMT